MPLIDDLKGDVTGVLTQQWDVRDGTVVPSTDSVKLAGGAVRLNATFLYADLADSTGMAMNLDVRVAAKIARAFLAICSRIIRQNGGAIRSFDGDRVMGIFLGDAKNSSAAKCALRIKYIFSDILKPEFEKRYADLAANHPLSYAVGIDTSEVWAVRGGIRNSSDLIWIGRAPNIAAKLSAIRKKYSRSFITPTVYNNLNDGSKYGPNGEDMWERVSWDGELSVIYQSSWHWRPS